MRSIVCAVFVLAVALANAGRAATQSASPAGLQGAWQIVEVTDQSGTDSKPQPGVYIFTKQHYSIVEMQGRSDAPDAPAGELIRSQSGTYEASAGSVRFRAIVARNPAAMTTGVQGTYSLANGVLTITTGQVTRKFKRLE